MMLPRWDKHFLRWPWIFAGVLLTSAAALSFHSAPAPHAVATAPAVEVESPTAPFDAVSPPASTAPPAVTSPLMVTSPPQWLIHVPARADRVELPEPEPGPSAPQGTVRELIPLPDGLPGAGAATPPAARAAFEIARRPAAPALPRLDPAAAPPAVVDGELRRLPPVAGARQDKSVLVVSDPAVRDSERVPTAKSMSQREDKHDGPAAAATSSIAAATLAPAPKFTPAHMIDALPESARQALREQVERRLAVGFDLAERRAYYSAKREFETALRMVADAIDGQTQQTTHADALARGLRAIEEADDFFVADPRAPSQIVLANIVVTHQTEVLQDGRAEGLTAVQAMQAYYAHAQYLLQQALDHEPYAAHALYGLGKTYLVLANDEQVEARLAGPKSLLMHQLAVTLDPNHVLAANELGVLLARYGQLPEAKRVLQATKVQQRPPELWHNLATVHERLGEQNWADSARQHYRYTDQMRRQQSLAKALTPPADGVHWVDVQELNAATAKAESTEQPAAANPASGERQAQRPGWPWSTGMGR